MSASESDSSLVFYWGSGSQYAWRAMLGLEFKGLSYESKQLQFSKGEHRTPEMLALNPRGKVPVLVEGDTVIYESIAILSYLERRNPEVPLFGATAAHSALIWQRVSEHDSYFAGPLGRIVRPIFFGRIEANREDIAKATEELQPELASLEKVLGEVQWLSGETVGAADIYYWVSVQQLLRAATKPDAEPLSLGVLPLVERYPNITAWKDRFAALPRVDRTWPPHWSA